MLEWTPTPQSSNIARVGYDTETQELVVEFKSGGTYAYDGVSANTAADLASDPSPGGYFSRHVRNRYQSRRL